MRRVRPIAAFLLLAGLQLFAQDPRGAFVGLVADDSGAVMPGVAVRAVNLETNVVAKGVTNDQGRYEILYLLPGDYRLEVSHPGFKAWSQAPLTLRAGDRTQLDIKLAVGAVTETVEVTAQPSVLETTTASVAQVVGSKEIANMPLHGGSVAWVFSMAPGVVMTNLPFDGPWNIDQSSQFSVGGTGANSVDFNMDGVSNNAYGGRAAFVPPPDMVQEVRIETSTYDAATGHTSGGAVNIAMKSGTNAFHGSVNAMEATGPMMTRNFFTDQYIFNPATGPITPEKIKANTPDIRWLQYSIVAGGPLVIPKVYDGHNKTFWEFGFQAHNRRRGNATINSVPTEAERNGDFSALLALGPQYQIYDPFTTVPSGASRYKRQPLPGNIIPASRMNPISKKIMGYIPLPNTPGTADGLSNYSNTSADTQDLYQPEGRVDHNFSESHRMFARYTQSNFTGSFDKLIPGSDVRGRFRQRPHRGFAFDDVHVLSPTMVLDVRYGLTWFRELQNYANNGWDLSEFDFPKSILGVMDPGGIAFPDITIGNVLELGNDGGWKQTDYTHSLSGTLNWSLGKHSMKIGTDDRIMFENRKDYGNVAPTLDFQEAYTRGPLDNSPVAPVGQGFASFLFGLPTGGWMDLNDSRAESSRLYSLFLQDDFRVNRKLTLNLGLRWEYESPNTERFNRTTREFDFQTVNPIQAQAAANYAKAPIPEIPVSQFQTIGGVTFAGIGGNPRGIRDSFWTGFMPRFGYAYQLTPKVVLRGGYGIFYAPIGVDFTNTLQPGFNQRTNVVATDDNGVSYIGSISNPLPFGVEPAKGASQGLLSYLGRSPGFFASDGRRPYTQRWSQSVQFEPAQGTVIELGYLGTRSVRLRASTQVNAIPAQYLSTSPVRDQDTIDFISSRVTNPFRGIDGFQGAALYTAANTTRGQLLRPYPQFTGLSTGLPAGSSWYHALTVRFERRFSKGIQMQANYTWSKTMEAVDYLNETDSIPEHVISAADRPHRLVLNGTWELPFGRGRKWASNAGGLLNGLIGGWQILSIYQIQSGPGLAFGNVIYNGTYDDLKLSGGEQSLDHWFNTTGFERNSQKQLGNNIRTLPSRFSTVRADGLNVLDVSAQKNFKLREKYTVQVRGQAEGALNHPNFAAPNVAPANSNFGRVLATLTKQEERRIFVGLKFLF